MFGRDPERITGRVIASKPGAQHGDTPGFGITRWKYVVEYTLPSGENKRVELKQAMGLDSMKMKNPPVGATVPLLLGRLGKVGFDVEDPRIAIDPDPDKAERAKQKDGYNQALKVHEDPGSATKSDRSGGTGGRDRDHPDPALRRARVAVREARRGGDPAEVERLTAELEQLEHGSTSARSPASISPGAGSVEQRLAKLQQLNANGLITSDEYSAQRQRILDSL
jgi:hypothetical protein